MALNSTINKVSLTIANMDVHYYQTHDITMAQHPSETDLRFMTRIVAFIVNASDELAFTKGLSTDDEPDIWVKTLTDEIDLWIDLGQPEEKRIRKACGRAKQVIIYTYHDNKASPWWQQQKSKLQRFKNLTVFHVNSTDIEKLVNRSMRLQCNIQDGEMTLSDDDNTAVVTVSNWAED